MAAFATQDRVQLRRLGVSLGVALVLHAAIAVALLNWGRLIFAINPTAPLVIDIDLAPLVGVTQDERASKPSASARAVSNAPVPAPTGGAKPIPESGGAIDRRDGLETAPIPSTPAAPPISAPVAPGGDNGAEGRASGGGAISGAAPEPGRGGASAVEPRAPVAGPMNTPLDTRITVMPDLYSKQGGGGFGPKKRPGVFFRPFRLPGTVGKAEHPGQAGQPERPGPLSLPEHPPSLRPAIGGAVTTNAVGAHVQDRARAALAREAARTGARNAIGGVASPGTVGGAGISAPEAVTKNAIGMTLPVHPNMPGTLPPEPKPGLITATGNTANHAAVGGHDMIRPGAAGVLGGPAKSRPGVLSGNDFHLRRP